MTAGVFAPRRPVCIVSPHLDDAVLSCGHFLAGEEGHGTTVLTVLAGAPQQNHDGYNRLSTGERWAPAAVAKRRAEDSAALALLGSRPHWLGLWDGDFRSGVPEQVERIASAVGTALAEIRPASVAFPLGYEHPDHLAVADACAGLAGDPAGDPECEWYVYADLPYTLGHPDGVRARLAGVGARLRLEELVPVPAAGDAKHEAFRLYASQYVPVSSELAGFADAVRGEERYWRVVAGP